eukprot:scaffold12159_cov86-Skeletonema_dohrnii-CCMP3373.AAC.3
MQWVVDGEHLLVVDKLFTLVACYRVIMADGRDNFVYMGGQQVVPEDVRHIIIDRSVNIILRAFRYRTHLLSVEMHDDVEKIEECAFVNCHSLTGIKLLGVREVETWAFFSCDRLSEVEFGDKLEIIGRNAFSGCPIRRMKLPSIRTIERGAFIDCRQLTDVEFGSNLETIESSAFSTCPLLRRIAIPLKFNMFRVDTTTAYQRYNQFNHCDNLITVDLVGGRGIKNTISSLLLQSWKDDLNAEIGFINQALPNTNKFEKTDLIRQWIPIVIHRMEHYKAEHNRLLKEHMTQLELALWKAKLDEKEDVSLETQPSKRAKLDIKSTRKEKRITSRANIVIKNVLPFLELR